MKLYSYFTKTVNKSTMPSPEPKKHAAQGIQGTYGRLIYRSRWLLLLLWIAVLLGCLPWARLVGGALSSGGYMQSDSEASLVEQALISQWHQGASHLFVLLTSHSTRINSPAYQRQFQYVIHWAEGVPDVSSVSESPGKDGYTAVVRLDFRQTSPTQVSHIPSFNDQLASLPPGPAHLLLTGDAAIRSDWQQIAEEDSRRAELIALPLVLCLLLLIFRSVVASLMPILLAVASVTGAETMLYGLATHLEVSIFALNVVTLVCLGLSIDYSLLLIHRFREELAREQTVEQALAITLATAGSAVFHSGLMVLLGFSGLLSIDLALLRSFGLGGICATTLAVLASLTLLPALLAIIGKRLDRFSFAFPRVTLPSRASQRLDTQSLWRRGAQMVMAHPMWVLLLVLSILIGLGWPALLLKPEMSGIKGLPDDSRARQGLELLRAQFPAFTDDTLLLLVQTADRSNLLSRPQHLLQLKTLTDWVSTLPHVTGVKGLMHPPQTLKSLSPTSLIQLYALDSSQLPPDIRVLVNTTTTGESTLLTITSNAPDGSDEEQQLLQRLHTIPPSISQGLHIHVGGTRAANREFTTTLYEQSLRPFLFLVLTTFLSLLLTFRSPLLALKAVLMNLFSLSAAFGTLVFVFQQGHFQSLLGFTAQGNVELFVPILLFCLLFGLSMDYEVFLLTRVREEWLRTGDNTLAIASGLEKTGGVITSAALLMVLVSSAFIFTSIIITKEIGLGITISILVDATLIRCLLVPATMRLLGKWNWWFPGLGV